MNQTFATVKASLLAALFSYLTILGTLPFACSVAAAQEISLAEMKSTVRSGICPSNTSTIAMITYSEVCGPVPEFCFEFEKDCNKGPWNNYQKCKPKVDALNEQIREYNSFMYECQDKFDKRRRAREEFERQQRMEQERQARAYEELLRQRQTEALAREREREKLEKVRERLEREQYEQQRREEMMTPNIPSQEASRDTRLSGFCGGDADCVRCLSGWRDSQGRYCSGYLKDTVEALCESMRDAQARGGNSAEINNRLANCNAHGF